MKNFHIFFLILIFFVAEIFEHSSCNDRMLRKYKISNKINRNIKNTKTSNNNTTKNFFETTTFLNCKQSLLPENYSPCTKLSNKDGEKILQFNRNSVEELFKNDLSEISSQSLNIFSLILNIESSILKSFICSQFSETEKRIQNDPEICPRISKLCTGIDSDTYNSKRFIEMMEKYNSPDYIRKPMSPIYRGLILNIDYELLTLAYYYIDKSIDIRILPQLANFDFILFQTETKIRYLYKVAGVRNYSYKLNVNPYRPHDKLSGINLNFRHENNLYRKNSLLNSFKQVKNKFDQCIVYQFIYTYYIKRLKTKREFFYYYHQIIDIVVGASSNPGRVVLKFEEYDLWFLPKKFQRVKRTFNGQINTSSKANSNNVYKNVPPKTINEYTKYLKNILPRRGSKFRFMQVKNENSIAPENIYYSNFGRKDFANEDTYLEKTINEQIKEKRKTSNSSTYKSSIIDLYREKSEEEIVEDRDFIQMK